MKRAFLSLFACILLSVSAFAESGDQHITVNAGIEAPYTLDATIGYEYEFANGHAAEIYAEAGNHWQRPVCHMFWKGYYWDGGVDYKYRIAKFKNSNLKIRGGMIFGADRGDFFFGAQLGFEWSYVFASNWEISIIQKNNFNFMNDDHFRNGIMFGVKIPLN